jgi:hypothetical protein
MKEYYGNYVGLVISGGNEDPEYRGRVQVFIPHIMPTIYEGWNEAGEDRQISITGNNLEGGLTQKEIEHLKKVLPWAECATPVVGAGPAGILDKTGNLVGELLNRGSGIVKGGLAKLIGSIAPGVNPSGLPTANPNQNLNGTNTTYQTDNTATSVNKTYIKPGASIFGYRDPEDNGVGAWGTSTNNTTTVGVSLPISVLTSVFGNADAAKGKVIEVYNPNTGKTVLAPIVDKGPSTNVTNGLDNTAGTVLALGGSITYDKNGNAIGTSGIENVSYRVLSPEEQTKYSQFSQNGGNIDAPLGDINNVIDLRAGDNNYKQEYGINPIIGGIRPNYPTSIDNTVQHPTPHPSSFGPNTNYQPTGSFGYARAGSMVWVFFQEGNPLFPVYFAASYGAAEWKNIYQSHSPAFGLTGAGNDGTNTENSFMSVHMDTGGGIRSGMSVANGTLDDEFIHEVFHKNGSNLKFSKSVVELNSMYDYKQTIMGDAHEAISCNKELMIQGDFNTVIHQDTFVTIGNWDASAIKAAEELQAIIDESMKLKSSS